MSPFLYTKLYSLLKILLNRFLKPEVLENANLCLVDVKKPANMMDVTKMKIGFQTSSGIKNCKKTYGNAAINKKMNCRFREDCQQILQRTVTKILERSPLKFSFT